MHRNREIVRMSKGSFCPLQQKERASKKKIVSLWGIVGGVSGLLTVMTFVGFVSLFVMLQSLNAMALWAELLSNSKAALAIFCIYTLFFVYFIFMLFGAPWVLVSEILISSKYKNRFVKSKLRQSFEALKMNIFILPIGLSVCFLVALRFNFLKGGVSFVLCIVMALTVSSVIALGIYPVRRCLLSGHCKRLPVKCVFFYYEGDIWGCLRIWVLKVLLVFIWIVVFYVFLLLPGDDINGIMQVLILAVIWGGYLSVILSQPHRLSHMKERFSLFTVVGCILILVVMWFSGKSLSYGLYHVIGFIQTEGNTRTYQISQEFFNKQLKIESLAERLYMQEQYAKSHITKLLNHQKVQFFKSVIRPMIVKASEVTGFSQYEYISKKLIKKQEDSVSESRDDGIANIKKQLEEPFKAYLGWDFGDKVVLCASEKLWLNCRSMNSSLKITTNLSSGLLIERKFFKMLPEVPDVVVKDIQLNN